MTVVVTELKVDAPVPRGESLEVEESADAPRAEKTIHDAAAATAIRRGRRIAHAKGFDFTEYASPRLTRKQCCPQ